MTLNETILSNINTSIKNFPDSSEDSILYLDEINEISIENEPKKFNLNLNLFSKLSKIEKNFNEKNLNEKNLNEINENLIFLRILLKNQRKIFMIFFSKIYLNFIENLKNSNLNSFLLINDLIISFKNENFYSKFLLKILPKIFEFKQKEKEKNIQNLINLILENLLKFCFNLNGLISILINFFDDENFNEISKNLFKNFISKGKFNKGKIQMKKIKEKMKNSNEILNFLNVFFENENLIQSGIFLESEMKIK
jgi:hypothetical protein